MNLEKYINILEKTPKHEARLIKILDIYLEAFPTVKDAYLFRYSPLGYLTEGIVAKKPGVGLFHIRDMRDDVRTVPLTHRAIRKRKAMIISKDDFLTYNPRYSFSAESSFLTVIPICFSYNVVGILMSTRFTVNASKIESLIPEFTQFGRLVGQVFERCYENNEEIKLTNREIEVMQHLAWGESVKTISHILNLSENTIKDYIKSAISKLGCQNRTHAVADLVRKGVIS